MQENQLDSVVSTDRQSAFNCVAFLLSCGYTKVAFFSEGNGTITPRLLRCQGYAEAIEKMCPPDGKPMIYEFGKADAENCRRCIVDFRNRFPQERIAILSVNGNAAPYIVQGFYAEGITPGWDYGLCTFDDWSWLRLAQPGITSVALKTELIGGESARLLLGRISGRRPYDAPAAHIEIPTKLNVRGSTMK
jgi:LacI family kdg operon repressor